MEEFKTWLDKAEDDLKWTKHNLDGEIYYGACFTSQQAVEKALKGFLLFKGQKLRKVHDLLALFEDCIGVDSSFEEFRPEIEVLSRYYITTRYPIYEDLVIFSKRDAEEAYEQAEKIIEFIRQKLTDIS